MPNNDYILRSDALKALSRGSGCENICSNAIKRIPAADVEPVRHGRWLPINRINPAWSQFGIKQHKCSECGSEEESARKRCPECGAHMNAELPKGEDDAEVH